MLVDTNLLRKSVGLIEKNTVGNGIMLEEFRANGLKLGIITDGRPEGQRAKIQVLGLEDITDCIIVLDNYICRMGVCMEESINHNLFEK